MIKLWNKSIEVFSTDKFIVNWELKYHVADLTNWKFRKQFYCTLLLGCMFSSDNSPSVRSLVRTKELSLSFRLQKPTWINRNSFFDWVCSAHLDCHHWMKMKTDYRYIYNKPVNCFIFQLGMQLQEISKL